MKYIYNFHFIDKIRFSSIKNSILMCYEYIRPKPIFRSILPIKGRKNKMKY